MCMYVCIHVCMYVCILLSAALEIFSALACNMKIKSAFKFATSQASACLTLCSAQNSNAGWVMHAYIYEDICLNYMLRYARMHIFTHAYMNTYALITCCVMHACMYECMYECLNYMLYIYIYINTHTYIVIGCALDPLLSCKSFKMSSALSMPPVRDRCSMHTCNVYVVCVPAKRERER